MAHVHWDVGGPATAPTIPVLTVSRETFVVLLGEFVSTETHFFQPAPHEKGRTVPCLTQHCPHCRDGIDRRRAHYAPALAHTRGDLDEESKPIWQRVVFFAPHGARALFGNAHQRGRKYRCQRIRVGCVLQLRAAFLDLVADGDKLPPEFDVRPILEKLWDRKHPRSPRPSDRPLSPEKTKDLLVAGIKARLNLPNGKGHTKGGDA